MIFFFYPLIIRAHQCGKTSQYCFCNFKKLIKWGVVFSRNLLGKAAHGACWRYFKPGHSCREIDPPGAPLPCYSLCRSSSLPSLLDNASPRGPQSVPLQGQLHSSPGLSHPAKKDFLCTRIKQWPLFPCPPHYMSCTGGKLPQAATCSACPVPWKLDPYSKEGLLPTTGHFPLPLPSRESLEKAREVKSPRRQCCWASLGQLQSQTR